MYVTDDKEKPLSAGMRVYHIEDKHTARAVDVVCVNCHCGCITIKDGRGAVQCVPRNSIERYVHRAYNKLVAPATVYPFEIKPTTVDYPLVWVRHSSQPHIVWQYRLKGKTEGCNEQGEFKDWLRNDCLCDNWRDALPLSFSGTVTLYFSDGRIGIVNVGPKRERKHPKFTCCCRCCSANKDSEKK